MIKNIIFMVGLIVAFSVPSFAADWKVDQANSQVSFSGTHAGNVFKGVFEKWDAHITFDLANLAVSSVKVVFDPSSAKTGNAMYDGTLPGEDWFKTNTYKTAAFETSSFTALDGNSYKASGTIQIRDKTNPVELPFELIISGADAKMTAKLSLDRLSFDLGVQSDADATWVSKMIDIEINLSAQQ